MGLPRHQECEILHTSCELFIGHNGPTSPDWLKMKNLRRLQSGGSRKRIGGDDRSPAPAGFKKSRAGADGPEDYDVAGPDGLVVGRIFKANTSPVGTPWMWTVSYGDHENRTPTHGYEATREAAMAAFAKSWRRE